MISYLWNEQLLYLSSLVSTSLVKLRFTCHAKSTFPQVPTNSYVTGGTLAQESKILSCQSWYHIVLEKAGKVQQSGEDILTDVVNHWNSVVIHLWTNWRVTGIAPISSCAYFTISSVTLVIVNASNAKLPSIHAKASFNPSDFLSQQTSMSMKKSPRHRNLTLLEDTDCKPPALISFPVNKNWALKIYNVVIIGTYYMMLHPNFNHLW